jgi:hypothetical protein
MATKSINGVDFANIRNINESSIGQNVNISNVPIEGIVTDGLRYWLDSRYGYSYSGSGTTWFDLREYTGSPDMSLVNTPTWVGNPDFRYFELDGTTDDMYTTPTGSYFFISQSNNIGASNSGITVSIWFKFVTSPTFLDAIFSTGYRTSGSTGGHPLILDCRNNASSNANGFAYAHLRNNDYVVVRYDKTHANGIWINMCGTSDFLTPKSASMALYENAVSKVSGIRTTPNFTWRDFNWFSSSLEIGNVSNLGRRPNIQVGQVLIYNRALTSTEVLNNYKATKGYFMRAVTESLSLHLNNTNPSSYNGTGDTWYDLTSNSNNAILINSPAYSFDNGGYFDLDGVNDYMDDASTTGTPFAFGTGAFTLEYWVRYDDDVIYHTILDARRRTDIFSNNLGYTDYRDPTNDKFKIYYNTSDAFTSTGTFAINTWYHIVLSRTNTSTNQTRLYKNNVLDTTGTLSSNFSDYGNYYIGRNVNTTGTTYSNIKIGQIRVYKGKALSAAEVENNWLASKEFYGY